MNLAETSAWGLRELISRREVSPVELLDACIGRIERYNPAVNAICATDFERARYAARAAEAQVMRGEPLGLLHGLPLGVKDLQATQGLLTTSGNVRLRASVPAADMSLVSRLRAAGAIVTAKTNTPDLGAGGNTRNPVWGATGNPFDPRLNAGGSSGGSAVALATDMLPLCTGSDTGGSLRLPASLCGVVGLRPSPGLVANDARPLGWSAISVLGPMARSVADAALMLQACAGPHLMDPLSLGIAPLTCWPPAPVDMRSLRIGFTADFGACAVDPMIRRVFAQRMEMLARDVAVCEPVPFDLADGHRCFDVIRAESFVAAFEEVYRNEPETLGPNVRANVEMAASITLADRAWAHLAQTQIMRRFQSEFARYDLIIAPVTPVSPFPWQQFYAEVIDGKVQRNYYEWLSLTYMVTLATNPTLALPCHLDEAGMPFGLQLIGPLHGDARLLGLGAVLESYFAEQDLARPRPNFSLLELPRPELKSIVTHPPLVGRVDGQTVFQAV